MARLFDDGSSEYCDIGSAAVSGEPFSMACWFYSDSITSTQALMSIADGDVTYQYYALRAEGAVAGDYIAAMSWDGNQTRKAQTTSGYSANTWHHAAGVWGASDDKHAYLDGGSEGTNSDSSFVTNTLDHMCIGCTADSTPAFYVSGRVAEAAIWDVALTDAEIAILGDKYSALWVRPDHIIAYWAFSIDDQDWMGDYDLSPQNTPSWAAHVPGMIYPARMPAAFNDVAIY